jgi:hypothetical protein
MLALKVVRKFKWAGLGLATNRYVKIHCIYISSFLLAFKVMNCYMQNSIELFLWKKGGELNLRSNPTGKIAGNEIFCKDGS